MFAKLIFILIAVKFHPSLAIECNFNSTFVLDHYCCDVEKDQFNDTQTNVTGTHLEGKRDSDVTALFVGAVNEVEFQPILCQHFVNLKLIHIERLEFAERKDFKDCKKTQILKIVTTELFWLPEDVFYDLTELRELRLTNNKLVYLPSELLVNNLKLEKFLAADNRLEIIELQFGRNVKEVSLSANKCIHRDAPSNEVKTIEEMNKLLRFNCISTTLKRLRTLQGSNDSAYEIKPILSATHSAELNRKSNLIIVLVCFCSFLIAGWAGSAFVMFKRIQEVAHRDHQYLMNMDFNDNREDDLREAL